jgi:hypothetical protein
MSLLLMIFPPRPSPIHHLLLPVFSFSLLAPSHSPFVVAITLPIHPTPFFFLTKDTKPFFFLPTKRSEQSQDYLFKTRTGSHVEIDRQTDRLGSFIRLISHR